jgi:hypothetical protein
LRTDIESSRLREIQGIDYDIQKMHQRLDEIGPDSLAAPGLHNAIVHAREVRAKLSGTLVSRVEITNDDDARLQLGRLTNAMATVIHAYLGPEAGTQARKFIERIVAGESVPELSQLRIVTVDAVPTAPKRITDGDAHEQ